MREFYLESMNPEEIVKVVSAPKQIYRGGGAYGSSVTTRPAQMTITAITDPSDVAQMTIIEVS